MSVFPSEDRGTLDLSPCPQQRRRAMIENLLKYQEIDGKIRQIEKELNDSENKKRGRHLSSYLRDAEHSVKKMESRSKEINIMLNGLLQTFFPLPLSELYT